VRTAMADAAGAILLVRRGSAPASQGRRANTPVCGWRPRRRRTRRKGRQGPDTVEAKRRRPWTAPARMRPTRQRRISGRPRAPIRAGPRADAAT
jgi:hypothetical protein